MSKEKIYIFDTTLRDGAQTEGVDFSVEDKNKIAKILSNIGVDYIEGGWPGANPIDNEFFDKSPNLGNSKPFLLEMYQMYARIQDKTISIIFIKTRSKS